MAQAKTRKRKRSGGILRFFVGDGRTSDISLPFFAYVMILLVVGLVMMASASYAWAYNDFNDGLYFAKKQALYAK